MFSTATANFVRQIDPHGSLIHVSRLNDSHKLVPMGLVIKRNRMWSWQRPKYRPADFTLSDLLQGDQALAAEVSQSDFLKYQGTYSDQHHGNLEVEAAQLNARLEGQGSSKLQSSFGNLKKEELDVKKLLKDSRNRLVDMQHVLVQQLEKRADVLAVVKERILTTSSCSVTQMRKKQCAFQGLLGLLSLLGGSAGVCVKDISNFEMDSDISIEIPPATVVAYSVLELEIEKSGHYSICLQPGRIGGFAAEPVSASLPHLNDTVDALWYQSNAKEEVSLGEQHDELQWEDLAPLAELPQSVRCTFTRKLQETLSDKSALLCLQYFLEELCEGDPAAVAVSEERYRVQRKSTITHQQSSARADETATLKAVYLLVSTMAELPDETLRLLNDTRPDVLSAFDALVSRLVKSSEVITVHSLPVLLQNNQVFQQAEQLLSSIEVDLRRDDEQIWMHTGVKDEVLLMLLSLSIHGMSLLYP